VRYKRAIDIGCDVIFCQVVRVGFASVEVSWHGASVVTFFRVPEQVGSVAATDAQVLHAATSHLVCTISGYRQ
jgi:hypothetical protein